MIQDPCYGNQCKEGKCKVTGNSYSCECNYGYEGIDCDQGNRIIPKISKVYRPLFSMYLFGPNRFVNGKFSQ